MNLLSGTATEKAITKKEACDILNISYNTTRLQKIIDSYVERKEYTKKRKKSLRGRPASQQEIQEVCESYLQGDTISNISKALFRSTGFVRSILEKVGVPQRPNNKEERMLPHIYPDECMSDDFEEGEVAWSATYHAPVTVLYRVTKEYVDAKKGMGKTDYENTYGCPCYSIYVKQRSEPNAEDPFALPTNGGFYAYQLAYELCKLEHLKEYGVRLERIGSV